MSSARTTPSFARRTRDAFAWVLAGLVLALSLLTAAPALHEHLHADDHAVAHDDSGCAVTLFGQGVTTPLALPQVEAPDIRPADPTFPAQTELFLTATPDLHPPGRGPPCIG